IYERHALAHAVRIHGRHLPDGDRRRRTFRRCRTRLLARQSTPAESVELSALRPRRDSGRGLRKGSFVRKPHSATLEARRPRKGGRLKPSRAEAEEAVRTLLRWAGDDPTREGLLGTPDRVVRAYKEFFSGYDVDPVAFLKRTFSEIDGYDELIVLRDIRFES